MNTAAPQNNFTVDHLSSEQKANLLDQLLKSSPVGEEIDINNPKVPPYRHQEFPKMVYHHDSGEVLTVADDKQFKTAIKRGFSEEPAAKRDYSQLNRANIAPIAATGPVRDTELSASGLAALDEEEEQS